MNKETGIKLGKWVANLPDEKVRLLCYNMLCDNIFGDNGYRCRTDDETGEFEVYITHSGERVL